VKGASQGRGRGAKVAVAFKKRVGRRREVAVTDEEVRRKILEGWRHESPGLRTCCGGRGLVVGCPTCGRRWGK
jgi:hypothetical protein